MNKLTSNKTRSYFLALVIGCFSILSGCATNNEALQSSKVSATTSPDYLIGAGDGLNVIVWRNPEVSMQVTVRPDGKISTPLVEDLVADGKTPSGLAREIEAKLSKFIQSPVVTVVVTTFSGPYQEQVRVIGQAAKPAALAYRQGMTLMDVIIAVGGMTEFAAGNKSNIIREEDGKQVKINVRLNSLLKDGDISANIPVKPGDILVIPQSLF
ncbi:XrtA/PEP-CTERM system exopolysaccharide export protein [Undibacterium sp. SXout20W]|uniref:XrtA/PEP-CTERM system exopolysaccharide export protein n=1 Tax=Undibacterium sp. SXout20W TaxID=3413051 RepID=UPI003BEF9596